MSFIKKFIKRSSNLIYFEAPNILTSGIHVPACVYIVASGPKGVEHYHRIPENSYIIAANKAVLIPQIKPDMWVLNSLNIKVLKWYAEADANFNGIKVFKKKCVDKLLDESIKPQCFCFLSNQQLEKDVYRLHPNAICGGGTVTGFAIQIAVHLGARDIILCGADMSGQDYWDGTSFDHPDHNDTWKHTAQLNLMIQYLCDEFNINVRSLSPTKLNIPVN